jgi:O-antigen/teichoic acid export membrane protein
MNLATMLRLMLGSVGLRFAGAGLGLLTQLVLTRTFPQAEVGIILLAMSMAAALSVVVALGYPLLALTQLPRFFALGVKHPVAAFHGTFLRDLAGVLLAVLMVAGLVVILSDVNQGFKLALVIGALSALPSAMLRYNSSVANGLRRFNLAFVPDFIFRPGAFFLYIMAAFFLGQQLSLVHVLIAYLGSNVLVAVVQGWLLRNDGIKWRDWFLGRASFTKVLRQRAVALAIVGAVTVMFADLVTLTGSWFLNHDDLAVLGLAIRLAAIAGFVIQAAQQFVLPDLTGAFAAREDDKADQMLLKLNLLTLITMAVGLVVAIAFGGLILGIFGQAYVAGHWLLVLFLLGQTIKALSGMNQNLMAIGGHQLRSAGACILGLVIFVASWGLLAPHFGLYAAGFAVILAELSWAVLLAAQVQQLMGRRADLIWLLTRRPTGPAS